MNPYKIGDPVEIIFGGYTGVIYGIRMDDRGDAIYTVVLDDPSITLDGLFYTRVFEIRRRPQ